MAGFLRRAGLSATAVLSCYNKTQQRHFWNFILMTKCKLHVYARGVAGGSQQREVADGADVVFTDTGGRGADRPGADRLWGRSSVSQYL